MHIYLRHVTCRLNNFGFHGRIDKITASDNMIDISIYLMYASLILYKFVSIIYF